MGSGSGGREAGKGVLRFGAIGNWLAGRRGTSRSVEASEKQEVKGVSSPRTDREQIVKVGLGVTGTKTALMAMKNPGALAGATGANACGMHYERQHRPRPQAEQSFIEVIRVAA